MVWYTLLIMGIILGCVSCTPKWRVILIYLTALSFSVALLSTSVIVLSWNFVFFSVISIFGYSSWVKEKLL